MASSDYYLERVGFEINARLRLNLKKGTNSIGRFRGKEKVDFSIASDRCSALHCLITVASDSVQIENKSVSVPSAKPKRCESFVPILLFDYFCREPVPR